MAVVVLVVLYYYVSKRTNLAEKSMMSTDLENERWASDRELNKLCKQTDFDNLPLAEDGIVVKAEGSGNKLKVNISSPIHTLIVGASGSGKTSTFVSPSIEILQRTKTKPSIVISDPKGELYATHAQGLRNSGYDVKVINLREPYKSTRWNPLSVVWDKFELSQTLQTEQRGGAYYVVHKRYEKFEDAEIARQSKMQSLADECYDDLNEIASALCPINPNEKDPIWRNGAKAFIHGILLAMLEDGDIGLMGKEGYTFGNLFNNLSRYMIGECEELKKYFVYRPASKATGLCNQVLEAPTNQMKSYLSSVTDAISLFADSGLCALTSENEINFEQFDEQPTALFLIIPDERTTRYKLATMLINKLYSELVSKASKNLDMGVTTQSTAQLKRNLYFLIDEFANLPKIEQMDTKITAARSRKIWFVLIIQSYAQLRNVYGREVADIIMGNCDINMFIGTTDQDTLENFSKRIGNKKISSKSLSRGSNNSVGENYSTQARPLMYPTELAQLNSRGNFGNTVVLMRGYHPIKSKFLQAHTSTKWTLGLKDENGENIRLYKEPECDYNFKTRNEMIEILLETQEEQLKAENADTKLDEVTQDVDVADTVDTSDKTKAKFIYEDLTKKPKDNSLAFLKTVGIDPTLDSSKIKRELEKKIIKARINHSMMELGSLISAKLKYEAIVGDDDETW